MLALLLLAALLAGCGSAAPEGPPALLFVSTKDGDYAIFGADANGKHVRRLTKEKGDAATREGLFFQVEPAWSPDGRSIAFTSLRDGISHVYVMRSDGTGIRRLTSGTKNDNHPSWSPDGRQIVFAREGALFIVSATGGKPRRVGRGLGNAANPAWSPDGRLIAYDYRRPGFSIREVYVMRSNGSGVRQLTRLRQVSALPAWSSDGARIAFESDATGRTEIYTVGPDGKAVRQVTRSDADAIQPAWSPDGGLSFSRGGQIWVSADGEETKLTSGENDSNPAWRPVRPK